MPLKKYLDYDGLDYLIQRIPRTKIKVTFDEVFAGETATCSMGTTTYTKTVPATEPYELVFPINELGTWTIATSYLGDDYGTTIEVTAIGQTATGHVSYITEIDGATVTPTDDITTWLKCANITDKSYTTLAEVLADRETFETLISDSNACDYMARSTSWAVALNSATGLVPVMTSNTTPSGQVEGGPAINGQYPAYKAFDGDDTTQTVLQQANATGYVQYDFPEDTNVKAFSYLIKSSSSQGITLNISCSDDNTNFTSCGSYRYEASSINSTKIFVLNADYGSHRYWRLTRVLDSTVWSDIAHTVQFYDVIDLTHSQSAMSLIGKYDYCSNALLSNATWAEAIANSEYWDKVLVPLVPTMTSDTTPSGECISTSAQTAYPNWKAFDGSSSSFWSINGANAGYIGYDFQQNVNVVKAAYINHNSSSNWAIDTFKIQYSDDGTTWQDATSVLTASRDTNLHSLSFASVGKHRYWNMYIVSAYPSFSTIWAAINELQFYGRASAQTNIVHSAPNDTIYMMENGSQVVLTTTNSDGVGTLDFTQFMDGTYTLYSSVAKNPNNLSNDFSKSIRITKTKYGGTTEAYLIPDIIKTLYWYGWDSNLIEDCISANGWSWSGIGLGTPTHNTNDITLNSALEGVKSIINGTHKIVVEGVTAVAGVYGMLGATPSKAVSSGDWTEFSTSGKLLLSKNVSSKYTFVGSINGRSSKIHAWWYE